MPEEPSEAKRKGIISVQIPRKSVMPRHLTGNVRELRSRLHATIITLFCSLFLHPTLRVVMRFVVTRDETFFYVLIQVTWRSHRTKIIPNYEKATLHVRLIYLFIYLFFFLEGRGGVQFLPLLFKYNLKFLHVKFDSLTVWQTTIFPFSFWAKRAP